MIHPDTELIRVDERVGLGVFATRRLPRGTITWVLDDLDQRIDADRLARLGPRYRVLVDRYAYLNGHGDRILCWDIGRFMNHSCRANSISTGWDFDIAVRDIEAGEEITNDYALLNLEHSFECQCGEPDCRRIVCSTGEEWDALTPRLDLEVRAACVDAGQLEQALWPFVREKASVRRTFRDPARALSVAAHRFDAIPAEPDRRTAAAGRL